MLLRRQCFLLGLQHVERTGDSLASSCRFDDIVYITEEGAAVLDEVVAFFAGEVERRIGRRVWCALWRESVCLAKGQLHRQINYILSNAKRRWIKENNPGLFKKVMGFRHWRLERAAATLAGVAGADSWDFRSFARDGGELWDVETGEEIAKPRKGNRVLSAFEEQQAAGGNGQATDGKTCCSTLAVACRPLARRARRQVGRKGRTRGCAC